MIYVVIYYIFSTFAYLTLGTDSMYWACFNMVSILGSLAIFLLAEKPNTHTFKMWADFAAYLTIGRIIYTMSASYATYEWIQKINIIFTIIYLIWLIIHIKMRLNGGLRST